MLHHSSIQFLSLFLILTITSSYNPNSVAAQSSSTTGDFPWRLSLNLTIVSPNGNFIAGFYPLRNSSNQKQQLYVFSVWYNKNIDPTQVVVWTANPTSPVTASASLSVNPSGLLFINDTSNMVSFPGNPTALNSNLTINNDGSLMFGNKWSSFNQPTDTLLQDQPFPPNGTYLYSRLQKDSTNFQPGKFMLVNSSYLIFNGTDNYWTSSSGMLTNLTADGKILRMNAQQLIVSDIALPNRLRRMTLDYDGNLRVYSLNTVTHEWSIAWEAILERCQIHGICGPNYICNIKNQITNCACPSGFRETPAGDCERKIPLSSNPNDTKFLRLDYVNFTGIGDNQTDLKPKDFETCQRGCLVDQRCLGFLYKIDGSQYCVYQRERLLNGYWTAGLQTMFYLKVAKNETDEPTFTGMTTLVNRMCPVTFQLKEPPKQTEKQTRNLIIISSFFALELIGGVMAFWAFLRNYSKYSNLALTLGLDLLPAGGPKRFNYAELKTATNDFSVVIGSGGFGTVYKGQLADGRVVAVKRLNECAASSKGTAEAEFWAEVTIIGRMHHLNLVRLWGFCTEKNQKLLVYEYVSNGALNRHLFIQKPTKKDDRDTKGSGSVGSISSDANSNNSGGGGGAVLDWGIRYRIAVGVARAIAYLHEECLEWVLHCDIKPENILLESDFCPKVSDFGLAKQRGKKEDMVSKSAIRGTRGYMAPEWVGPQPITAKADVYSFGMVLLELVSGRRNNEIINQQQQHKSVVEESMHSDSFYFPQWAFQKVYMEMEVEAILDPRIKDSYDSRQHFAMVDRMVKTAMWCLQDQPEHRPSMGKVAKMLEGTVEIMEPSKPTIFFLD